MLLVGRRCSERTAAPSSLDHHGGSLEPATSMGTGRPIAFGPTVLPARSKSGLWTAIRLLVGQRCSERTAAPLSLDRHGASLEPGCSSRSKSPDAARTQPA